MSLGISSSWRVRPELFGLPRLSSIPRELLSLRRPALASHCPIACPNSITARSWHASATQAVSAAERTRASAYPTASTTSTTAASDPAPTSTEPQTPTSPGSNLIARLADLPIRQHGRQSSVLVEPLLTYPSKPETTRSRRRHHQSLTRQARLEAIRQAQLKPLPDWRVVLRNLTAWTPDTISSEDNQRHCKAVDAQRRDVVKIIVPEAAVSALLRGVDTNLWAIRASTGCELKLCRGSEQDGSSSLFLSGSDRDVARAVNEVLQHATGAYLAPREGGDAVSAKSNGQVSETAALEVISTELDRRPGHGAYALTQSAHNIPKPTEWTKESFLGYVAALVKGELAPHLASRVYPRGTLHEDAVISILHGIFNEESARSSLSTTAFKMALSFMTQRGHSHRPDARALYVRMEMFGLPMDVETFNILLASTAKVRDLRNFDSTMRLMNGRGFAPDLNTWILFMRVIESEEVKRYILHAMNSKGLLDTPAAARLVAREMVPFDIDRAVQQNMDVPSFLAEQEARYGAGWLTRDVGNRVLEVLGRYGRFAECTAFLDVMVDTPGAHPDVVSYNTVLTHCKVQNKLGTALATLRHMERVAVLHPRPGLEPDATTYHLLFELGWKRRMVQFVGAVWRYASLARATSFRMRRRASQALSTASSTTTTTPTAPTADGSAASAASRILPAHAILDDEARRETRLVPATTAKTKGATRPWRRLGAAASRYYAERYRGWEPAVPLGEVLSEALGRDVAHLKLVKEARVGAGADAADGGPASNDAKEVAAREPMSFPLRKALGGGGDRAVDGDEAGGAAELTRRIYF